MADPFPPFDPVVLICTLHDQGVQFVVIGGVAARARGSPSITSDLDICHERSRTNLERLATALKLLRAELRGAEPGLPFRLDARTLEMGDSFTFTTVEGNLDCLGTPSGTAGFTDLVVKSGDVNFDGRLVKVASLEDIMRMKRAAGRPKDRIELEVLEALRQEIEAARTSG